MTTTTTTTTTARRGPLLPRAKADTWQLLFGTVYLVMATNIMLAVASLPLLVLLVTTDPSASWPVLAVAAVAAAPGLSAACAVFAGFTTQRSTDVVRTFARAWLTHLRRSLAIGGLAVAAATVLVVDLVWAAGTRLGAVLTPVLLMLLVLTLATVTLAFVAGVERPDARLRDVLKVSLYLGVRRWYLTLVSFVVLGMLTLIFAEQPGFAVGLLAAPLLYAVWGNSRHSLRPVLHPDDAAAA